MALYMADQNQVALLFESGTYANPSGGALWPGLGTNHSIDENKGIVQLRHLGGGTRNVDLYVDTTIDYAGTLTFNPQDFRLLGFALGSMRDVTSASGTAHFLEEIDGDSVPMNAYVTRTIIGSISPFISFAVEDAHVSQTGSNFLRTVRGACVNTYTLSIAEGEPATVEVAYLARGMPSSGALVVYSSGAATSVTASTYRPFLWSDFALSGQLFMVQHLKSLSLTINNNLETRNYAAGSRLHPQYISAIIPGNRNYELSVTADLDEDRRTQWYNDYFIAGSRFSTTLSVDAKYADLGSTHGAFVLSGCKILDFDAPTPGEGTNETTLTISVQSMAGSVYDDKITRYNPW